MKTYTCTTCNENFVGKASYDQHLVSDAHKANREAREEEKRAAEAWKVAQRIAVRTDERWIHTEDKAHQALAWENGNLAADVKQLEKEARYIAERTTRDIASRVAERGAAAVYSGSNFQNLHEVPNLEGRVYGRSQTLIAMASVLGYRCEATFDPREWKFYEMLASITVSAGYAEDPGWRLTQGADGPMGGRFPTEAAAIAAAVKFVRMQMEKEAA